MGYCHEISLLLLLTTAVLVSGTPSRQKREAPDLEPGNWPSCKPGAEAPPTRVPTADRVQYLRTYFASNYIQAYIIPNEDAHQSEYPSNYDKRRGYISGFQGSAGFAVVTMNRSALWTDGRYFLEAEDTLDCTWTLMRQGETGVPTSTEWLKSQLTTGSVVGVSPYLMSSSGWKSYQDSLADAGISMRPIYAELIDMFWNAQLRPSRPNTDIYALPMKYAGRSWQEKVADMRVAMDEQGVDMLVATSLDETAWLFNLRASDISYNPFFISYAIIDKDSVRLYILDSINKISKQSSDAPSSITVADHLNTDASNGSCAGRVGPCVEVKEYSPDAILTDVAGGAANATKVWISHSCNYAIFSRIEASKIYQANTPIATTKTKKNPTEVAGMKNAHIRDAVALVSFLAKLEKEVKDGKRWTELSASDELERYRRRQEHNRGLSFTTISGSGANGAIIHYSASNLTDTPITTRAMYLLDSGGQYLDGTTDVTRTFHFGTPTEYQKECYTRVLMGHIDLFQAIWAKGLYGREVDAFARAPLWDVGLVYRHGTGHGIGMFLSVHEAPAYISKSYYSPQDKLVIIEDTQFLSIEPGYYEDGEFGIRLENIVMVTNATTKYHFPNTQFLTFEHITFVPYDPNLINYELLNEKQIKYLNDYNTMCREKIGPELKRQGETAGYEWLMQKTAIVGRTTSGTNLSSQLSVQLMLSILFVVLVLC